MDSPVQHGKTRVWWDGGEVEFIRWTDKSLVFCWDNTMDTAVHMPRGALVRLIRKGVMQIEGEMPAWIEQTRSGLRPSGTATKTTESTHNAPAQPVSQQADGLQLVKGSHAQAAHANAIQPRQQPQQTTSISVISRLIRRLAGVV
ncbi:MAG: hypothetical protein JXJ20_06925 [Anaerolineae bacterium]|jgi:hypothetical protein|nr:hypothetical protein [Anaerolineae bacterium]